MEDDRQQSRIRNIGGVYGDDGSNRSKQTQLLTALPTSTCQATGAGDGAQGEHHFGYTQEYQYPTRQFHRSSSQYQPAYLQGPINQEQFPQDASRMAYKAPTQPLYDDMPSYQSRQPTAAEIMSKQFNFPQSPPAGDDRIVSGLRIMPQQYPAALYQQRLQYDHTTDLEHSTLASSDPRAESEQAAGAEPIDQQQRETDSYDHVYSQLMKTNENTFHGRLVAAVETLFEISEWLFSHAVGLGMSRMVL